MDLRIVWTTFLTLFLAEIGDKTQLAVISMSASTKKPWSVFVGGLLGLALVTAVGAIFGEAITRVVPEHFVKKGAALLFIAVGVWTWFHP